VASQRTSGIRRVVDFLENDLCVAMLFVLLIGVVYILSIFYVGSEFASIHVSSHILCYALRVAVHATACGMCSSTCAEACTVHVTPQCVLRV